MKKFLTLAILAASLMLCSGFPVNGVRLPVYYSEPSVDNQTYYYYLLTPGHTYQFRVGGEVVYQFFWASGGWNIYLLIAQQGDDEVEVWDVTNPSLKLKRAFKR